MCLFQKDGEVELQGPLWLFLSFSLRESIAALLPFGQITYRWVGDHGGIPDVDRYARMLEIGIIDKERWPLPPMEKGVLDGEMVDHKEWRIRNMAIYAAMVDHMDQAVGLIVDAIESTNQLDDTLIVYFNHSNTHAVITGDYKIVRERNGAWALYNLAKDRTEMNDLSSEQPDRLVEMAVL